MRVCPSGLEEITNEGGAPFARIERNYPFDVRQVLGTCTSKSCGKRDWLTVNKGTDWFCDADCRKSYEAQVKSAKKAAAADAAAASLAAKIARINARQAAR